MARSFNGSSDQIEVTNSTSGSYSVVALLKPGTFTYNRNVVVNTNANGPLLAWSHCLRIAAFAQTQLYTYPTNTALSASPVVSTGVRVLVGASFTAGGTAQTYVDGVASGSPVSVGTPWSGGTRQIVGTGDGAAWYRFDGEIQWIAWWSAALSAAEHAELAAGKTPLQIATTPAWYLNLTADAPADLSGNGHAVVTTGTTVTDDFSLSLPLPELAWQSRLVDRVVETWDVLPSGLLIPYRG